MISSMTNSPQQNKLATENTENTENTEKKQIAKHVPHQVVLSKFLFSL